MTKKDLWTEILGWCRGRYNELLNTKSFLEGNVSMEGRLFSDVLFSDPWLKLTAISEGTASFSDDVRFLRKLIGKAIQSENKENLTLFIATKKAMAFQYVEENDGVYEHQVATAIGLQIGRAVHNSITITVLGMLEKEKQIKKDGNIWVKL